MAIYTYEGQQYTLEDGLTNQEALRKIKKYLELQDKKDTTEKTKPLTEESTKEKEVKDETSEDKPNWLTATGAGLISGAIKIPEGIVSLGADLIDLGFDTNVAQKVEDAFDKINIFEEVAEQRTVGKVVETLASFGIPTTIGFNIGRKIAGKAIRAAKAGKYKKLEELEDQFTKTKGKKKYEIEKQINKQKADLKRAERRFSILGGASGAGVGEAIVVDEEIGTIGDALPEAFNWTALDRDENLSGRRDAIRRLKNRLKGGVEGAAVGQLIGGTLSTVGKVSKKGFDALFDSDPIIRKVDKILSYLRPRGALSQETFERLKLMEGSINANRSFARQNMDLIENEIKTVANKLARKARTPEQINKIALAVDEFLKGGSVEDYYQALRETGLSDGALKEVTTTGLQNVKNEIANMSTTLKNYIEEVKGVPGLSKKEIEELDTLSKTIADNAGKYITRKYAAVEKRRFAQLGRFFGNNPFKNWQPLKEEVDVATDFIQNQLRKEYLEKNPKLLKSLVSKKELDRLDALAKKNKTTLSSELAKYVAKNPNLSSKVINEDTVYTIEKEADEQIAKLIAGELDSLQRYSPGFKLDLGKGVDTSALIRRKVPKELRGVLGEIKDPTYNVGMTMGRIGKLLEEAKAYNEIAKTGEGRWLFSSADDAAKAFKVKVEDIQELKFADGALPNDMSGKFTIKDIANEFMENSSRNKLLDLYKYSLVLPKSISQKMKTIYSPFTHVRNFISGALFTTMNGNGIEALKSVVNPSTYKTLATGQQTGLRKLVTDPEAFKKYQKLQKLGVINTSVTFGEANRLFKDAAKIVETGDEGLDVLFNRAMEPIKGVNKLKETVKKGGKVISQGARDFYMAEDDIWKMASFDAELLKYKKAIDQNTFDDLIKRWQAGDTKANQTITKLLGRNIDEVNDLVRVGKEIDLVKSREQFLDVVSANIVKNTVPNYNYVPKLVKFISYLPLGNFVSFPAEIIRTSAGVLAKGVDEIQLGKELGSKALQARGVGRITGAITTGAAVPVAAVEMAKGLYGATDETIEAIREFVPWFQEGNLIQPLGKTEDGKGYRYRDLSYIFPYDTMVAPAIGVMAAVGKGENEESIKANILQGAINGFSKLISPFASESMLTEKLADVSPLLGRGGQTKDRRDVYETTDSLDAKVTKSLAHIFDAFLPGSLNQIKRLVYAEDGIGVNVFDTEPQPDKHNRTYKFGDEFGGIFGFRVQEIDPATSAKYKVTQFNNDTREIEGAFIGKAITKAGLLGYGVPSVDDIVSEYMYAEKQRFKTFKDMERFYSASKELGVNVPGVRKELDRIRDKGMKDSIITGRYDPIELGKGQRDIFLQKAREIESPIVREQFRKTYAEALRIIQQLSNKNRNKSLLDGELDFGAFEGLIDKMQQSKAPVEPQPVTPGQTTPDTGPGSVVTGQGPTIQGQGSTLGQTDVRFRKGTLTDPTERLIAGVD